MFAESVSIGSISVPVDEKVEVDSKNVKITLHGVSKINSQAHIGEDLLNLYLADKSAVVNVPVEVSSAQPVMVNAPNVSELPKKYIPLEDWVVIVTAALSAI